MGDTIYSVTDKVTHKKVHICEACESLSDLCFACGLPVKKAGAELPDGRMLCDRDAKNAVLDDAEDQKICDDVKDDLDRLFSRFIDFPTNIIFSVSDRVNLVALFKVPGNDVQCPNILGYFRCATNNNRIEYRVNVMSALTRSETRQVCAHECAHAWIAANVSAQRKAVLDSDAEEGFCELVSYMLMDSLHDDHEKSEILANAYTRGQIDLFIRAKDRFGFNDIADWMKYGVDVRLSSTRLEKVRDVDIPKAATIPVLAMPAVKQPTGTPRTPMSQSVAETNKSAR